LRLRLRDAGKADERRAQRARNGCSSLDHAKSPVVVERNES
jgi:hypothetical protein